MTANHAVVDDSFPYFMNRSWANGDRGQRITDMRADFARDIDRMERRQDAHTGWALDESNMTRGYIWTGKVPVANPHPKEQ